MFVLHHTSRKDWKAHTKPVTHHLQPCSMLCGIQACLPWVHSPAQAAGTFLPYSRPSYMDIYSDQCYIFRPMLNLLLTQASAPRLVAYHLWFVLCSAQVCLPFCGCYSPKGDSPCPKAPVPLFSGGEQGWANWESPRRAAMSRCPTRSVEENS